MTKFVPALAMLLIAAPAFAQSGATQSPPSPNSSQSAPQPANSMPPGVSNVVPGTSLTSGPVGSTNTTTGGPGGTVPSQSPGADAFTKTVPTPAVK